VPVHFFKLEVIAMSHLNISKDRKLEYIIGGPNPNVPPSVVVVHPQGLNFTAMQKMGAELDRTIIYYDILGHGGSTPSKDPLDYSLEHHVNDLTALINHTRAKKVAVIGYSLGGFIAQKFAASHPNKTSKLVLISTSYNVPETFGTTKYGGLMLLVRPFLKNSFLAANVAARKLFGIPDNYRPNFYELQESISLSGSKGQWEFEILKELLKLDPDYIKSACTSRDAAVKYDTRHCLSGILAKTLILHAEEDRMFPPDLVPKVLHEMIQNSEHPIIIPGASHAVLFEHARLIGKIIRHFIDYKDFDIT
jgi:pimeloyl-ACP methyl ester carboxylesterase